MMTISWEDYNHLMKLHAIPTAPPTHSSHHASTSGSGIALLASLPDSWIIDSRASAHMSGAQSLLAYPNYHNLPLFLLGLVVHVLLWDMVRPIQPPHSSYLKFFMFPIFLGTSYLSVPSPKHYFSPSHSFLTISPFKLCG